MALKLEGRDERLGRKDFIAFGERVGVPRAATERTLDRLIKGVGPHVERLDEIGFDERKTRNMQRAITKRLDQLGA